MSHRANEGQGSKPNDASGTANAEAPTAKQFKVEQAAQRSKARGLDQKEREAAATNARPTGAGQAAEKAKERQTACGQEEATILMLEWTETYGNEDTTTITFCDIVCKLGR